MAASTALIALEPPAMDQPMLVAWATRTPEHLGLTGLLQSSLTLRLGAVQPQELRQGEAFLKLDDAARHRLAGRCLPARAPRSPCTA